MRVALRVIVVHELRVVSIIHASGISQVHGIGGIGIYITAIFFRIREYTVKHDVGRVRVGIFESAIHLRLSFFTGFTHQRGLQPLFTQGIQGLRAFGVVSARFDALRGLQAVLRQVELEHIIFLLILSLHVALHIILRHGSIVVSGSIAHIILVVRKDIGMLRNVFYPIAVGDEVQAFFPLYLEGDSGVHALQFYDRISMFAPCSTLYLSRLRHAYLSAFLACFHPARHQKVRTLDIGRYQQARRAGQQFFFGFYPCQGLRAQCTRPTGGIGHGIEPLVIPRVHGKIKFNTV